MNFELRKWKLEYIADVARYADNEKIAANLRNVFPYPYTRQDAENYVRSCAENTEERQLCRAIVVEGHTIGSIGIFCGSDLYGEKRRTGILAGGRFLGVKGS